jgi:hypothetical protein
MKWNFIKLIFVSCAISLIRAQFWDFSNWGDEDEGNNEAFEEDSDEMWELEDEEYSEKLIKMSLSSIEDEKRLLQESSDLIIDTIYSEIHNDLIEENMNQISEIISDHTVDLYNILHVLESQREDEKRPKLKVSDIFLWSNDSSNRINEIIASFYNS